MSHSRRVQDELSNPEFRAAYFEELYNGLIAGQIKSNREARDLTQAQLAQAAGMQQSAISRLENVNYESWSVSTLRRLARALDLVLSVRFESFGKALHETDRFDGAALVRPSYAEDPDLQPAEPASTGSARAVIGWTGGRLIQAGGRFIATASTDTQRGVSYG